MKKYDTPELILIESSRRTFLEVSGEAIGVDIFDGGYGKEFESFS